MLTATNRRKHIQEQFSKGKIPFQFFDACTPSPTLSAYLQTYLPNLLPVSTLTMGEKGCLASHFMLWKKCVDEDLDYITIFEDDILLGKDAENYLIKDDWLKERFDLDNFFILRLETFLMPVEIEYEDAVTPFLGREFNILKSKHFGTAGYMISRTAANYLINLFQSISGDNIEAIDEIIFNRLIMESDDYVVHQLNPAICVQELQFNKESSFLSSDLEKDRCERKKREKKKKTLIQRLIKVKDNILRAMNKMTKNEKTNENDIKNKEIIKFL